VKPKPVLGLVLLSALAPLAWASPQPQASQAKAAASSQANALGHANLSGRQAGAAIQSGTRISARLLTNLNAKKAKPGQRVVARVTQNVKQNGRIVIHKNARLLGHVVSARPSGKGNAGSQLQVVFDRMVQGHATTALNTVVTSIVSLPVAPMSGPEPMQQPEPAPMGPAPMGAGGSGGGGLLGGVGGAVGGAVGAAANSTAAATGNVAGNAGTMAGSTLGRANRIGAQAMGSAANAITVTNTAGPIGAASTTGATGAASAGLSNRMANAALDASGQASNQTDATSTFNRRNGNLELNSGTELQFQVAGSAQARTPAPH
jgi:hypothetical protein